MLYTTFRDDCATSVFTIKTSFAEITIKTHFDEFRFKNSKGNATTGCVFCLTVYNNKMT